MIVKSANNNSKPDFKELTKHIGAKRAERSKAAAANRKPSLKKQMLTKGVLCKDCHRYLARFHYSVCKRCYEKRVKRFLKSGGVYVLTPAMHRKLERELRV